MTRHDEQAADTRREELKRLLERRRSEILDQLHTALRDVSVTREIERHDVRDDMEQSEGEVRYDVDLALLEIRSETLARIDEALARFADEGYGQCLECGGDIPVARLAAMPFATRCTRCEQAREDSRPRQAAGGRRDYRAEGWEERIREVRSSERYSVAVVD